MVRLEMQITNNYCLKNIQETGNEAQKLFQADEIN